MNYAMHIPTMPRHSRVKLTSGKSSYDQNDLQINQDEPLITFFNHCVPHEPLTAELLPSGNKCDRSRLSIDSGSLTISFRRTIRVPDTGKPNQLPPGLGSFPLYNVAEFAHVLPQDMVEKGGLFFAMYQREAMWLQFTSKKPFAIRIYVGGVNGITGEPMIPNMATLLKRQNGVEKKQDYIIVPEQPWLDGIATGPGMVKQFVAVPYGSGYSIEHQITGSETTGGIQFEVIPVYEDSVHFEGRDIYHTPRELGLPVGSEMTMTNLKVAPSRTSGGMRIHVNLLPRGETITVWTDSCDTIGRLISRVPVNDGIEYGLSKTNSWLFLDSRRTLLDYDIRAETTLYLIYNPRGGSTGQETPMMSFGAGGTIKQAINEDHNNPRIWDIGRAKIFNVQVLNSARFEDITKMLAPPTPVDVKTYAAAGLPFFDIFNEVPTDVHGSARFKNVKTVSEMDQKLGAGSSVTYKPGAHVPLQKCKCQINMLGCVIRPCNHAVCSVCAAYGSCSRCPVCRKAATRIVGIAAPMGAPGTESIPKLPVVLLERHQVDDGREEFVSIVRDGAK